MAHSDPDQSSFLDRAVEWLVAILRRHRGNVERRTFIISAVAFCAGLAIAFTAVDIPPSGVEWRYLVLSLVLGVPATAAVNALEVKAAGYQVKSKIRYRSALSVAILGTAANLLPVPGAALVRAGDLIGRGASPRASARVQIALAMLWTGVSAAGIAAAGLALDIDLPWLWAVGAVGFIAVGTRALINRSWTAWFALITIEVTLVIITGLRLLAAWKALGIDASLLVAVAVAGANALAALAWVIPSGLALREFLGSLLGSMFGLTPAAGFTAQGLDRVVGLIGHLALAPIVQLWVSKDPERQAPEVEPDHNS